MKPGILVIGLDAATFDLIDPWADRGELPSLARLMREGTRGRMKSTANMHSASAWTSLLTGLNPGRHGLFVFSDRDFETGRHVFFQGGDRNGETLPGYLNRTGLKTGMLNVPMTYPAQCGPDGFMVSGLDAPSLDDRAFCPASLRDELFGRFPDYVYGPPGLGDLMRRGRVAEAADAWIRQITTQTNAAIYLLNSRPLDFFMTVYTASDWGGHNLWRFDGPIPPSSQTHEGEAALLSIYKALDSAVGSLVEFAGPKTRVYVISDHGMGPHTGASYHLAAWLESKGYMVRKTVSGKTSSPGVRGMRGVWDKLPVRLKETVKSGIGRERVKRFQTGARDSFYSSIDWERTIAYAEPGRHIININLAGRNPRGKVPRDDYDSVCDQISRELSAWTDSIGRPAVDRVAKRSECYHGPFVERASDMHIYWNGDARFGDPPPEVKQRRFWWSGDHRLEGILICKGPDIRRGELVSGCGVCDLTPTIMYLAGMILPAGLDGRVIEGLCTDEFRAKNPIRFDDYGDTAAAASKDLGEREEELMAEKLRSLGYM